jgi:hypothetical protein
MNAPDSMVAAEKLFRDFVFTKVSNNMLYAFDFDEGTDVSLNNAGALLEQDADFWLFEWHIEDSGRAGPGRDSPRRYWGALDLSVLTKGPRDKVKFTGLLEQVANWFQDETVSGIRFRTFVPTPAAPLKGFTSYSGVINFDFETPAR